MAMRGSGRAQLENTSKRSCARSLLKSCKSQEKKKKAKFKKVTVSERNLEKFLGKPVFTTDRFYERTRSACAWDSLGPRMGGATLYVEATHVAAEKTEMKLTGQAGDVMKESSQIAWTYLHSMVEKYAPGIPFLKNRQVHVHIPEGATPKDGPSAGITMVTACFRFCAMSLCSKI